MKWPFPRRAGAALRRASASVALLAAVGCGGADAPGGPSSPSPPPSASPQAGGALTGAYVLEVRPAAACGMGGPLSFPMTAAAAGTSPYPGVQVLFAGSETLELEFLSSTTEVTGGFGTTEDGALANETVRLWIHAIGTGAVTRATDGRGQITAGRLAGYIAFGHANGDEGSLGSCDSSGHSFILRVR
jgi:hypothetical protein